MANTAIVDYRFTGDKEQLEELYETLETAFMLKNENSDLHEVSRLLGINSIARGYDLRSDICDLSANRDESNELNDIGIFCESSWNEKEDFRNKVIAPRFPGIKVFFRCSEPGCDLYYSNDVDHMFFKALYNIDIEDYGGDELDSLTEVVEYIGHATKGELLLSRCTSFYEIRKNLEIWLDKNCKCGGLHLIDYSEHY